jgi:phosphatidylinositol alpha-mannosyltransferase
LYLGRLEKRKGLQYLLIAYARLREDHDDVKLIIAGNGMKRESLEKYIIQYEIPDVTFTGFVPEADKVGVLASADLFCSPSIYGESFGIILLENMALGVPIVAGNNPGYQGVMKGLGRVSLVTPAATEDFSQRLELMLYNEDIRELWKKWAKKEIQQYDFYKVADAYEEVYKKALKKYA